MPYLFNALCSEPTLAKAWSRVKAKGSAGGIDGVSLEDFERKKYQLIPKIAELLKAGAWKPLPYVEIEVAKNKNPEETRKLGLAAVGDKVVQHAIKLVIEPRLERLFLGNSYAYRPGKSAVKAIRRVMLESKSRGINFVLRLDIDDFFDHIDHDILQKRLMATVADLEVVRLIMLCVEMGKVKQGSLKWIDSEEGTPQGAVLSPLLSNLYLHSFDQFAVSRNAPYVRYADDFLFLTPTREQAEEILQSTSTYLQEKLHLSLNQPPEIKALNDGFEFLGVTILDGKASISEKKREQLAERIKTLEIDDDGFTRKSYKAWNGMLNYYGKLLPESDLEMFDSLLTGHLKGVVHGYPQLFRNKTSLRYALGTIPFMSESGRNLKAQIREEIVAEYVGSPTSERQQQDAAVNKRIVDERKREFRKKESEASGLLVNRPGVFIGLTSRGVTVSQRGKVISRSLPDNLSQIVITGQGVSLSSNLVSFCMGRRIPVDFFDSRGTHLGSLLSAKTIQNSLWAKQAAAPDDVKHSIALAIISGKIRNQHALVKYFHKYHKAHYPRLAAKMEDMDAVVSPFKKWRKKINLDAPEFMQLLVGHEAQVAVTYWEYIRELLSDDQIGFDHREHKGAQDLFNSMLNYGYSILYARVWQALLEARLNPFESLIHAKRDGKPTLVYDVVELFRSQVVDRVVIGLVQKGQDLEISKGLLTDNTRALLVKSVMNRLARYEKFQGQEMRMEQIIHQQAKAIAKAFETDGKFKPYVAKW